MSSDNSVRVREILLPQWLAVLHDKCIIVVLFLNEREYVSYIDLRASISKDIVRLYNDISKYIVRLYNDKDYDSTILRWYNELGSDASDVEESSDIVSDHESDSKQSADDEQLVLDDHLTQQSLSSENIHNDSSTKGTNFYGKHRHKWFFNAANSLMQPTRNVRTPSHDIVLTLPGL
ncbi:hypothetical protein QE152_g5192 [Popillia japonica]|uniref:Uncharacterized protein n=1 Tax=Popillia japonica TaxID=7064 RepID=A0AAW1MR19_POPJA